ncbi:MAG: metal-dependent hydrolase [Candidatus Saganbacteria bacterium]|uniref:Metal-dependent hydrolase n=1 Tax=Candidatus Saganbacteria bacterium TaxID=2575572 RepID=A0A833L2I3_UNCSA|nr:MAG: metal-dependent hydrolase [Candidatus Saganbacteria bacterium]
MNKYLKISYDLTPDMPIFENNPSNKYKEVNSFKKGDNWSSASVTIFTHNGTHIDAPYHFYPRGKKIGDYQIKEFIFNRCSVLDIVKKVGESINANDLCGGEDKKCDLLLIRTGFGRKRKESAYIHNGPWLHPEATDVILKNYPKLKAIGIDTISIASPQHLKKGEAAHRILLKKVMIIEDLNLEIVPERIKRIFVIPLFVKDVDSMPCTAFAEVEE